MISKHVNIKLVILALIFLSGLYYYIKYGSGIEGFDSKSGVRCPNILIQKGSKYYLYNSNIAQVPGVNPIMFNSLEEYTDFLEWQRGAGIRCPVLYVQNTYDIQGERVYKVRPSVSELQGGLPPSTLNNPIPTSKLVDATQADDPYNNNSYPAYDPTSQYVGTQTPLDEMESANKNMLYSDNAMDPNWGGAAYTQKLVDEGAYAGNEIA